MGERFRRVFRYLFSLLIDSAAPAMLLIGLLLSIMLCVPSLMPENPQYYFTMLFWVIWVTCAGNVAAHRRIQPPKGTPEYQAVVKVFGRYGRKDRLFSKAIAAFVEDDIPYALELFLQVHEMSLSTLQRSACCYYAARCYHAMGCCSNARQFYEKAEEGGFAAEYNLLCYARCCGHAGDVEASMTLYQRLLEMKCQQLELVKADMGMMLLQNDHPAEALEWFRRAEEAGECYADALGGIAVAQLYLGNEEESRAYYRKALLAMDDEGKRGFQSYYEEAKETAAKFADSARRE